MAEKRKAEEKQAKGKASKSDARKPGAKKPAAGKPAAKKKTEGKPEKEAKVGGEPLGEEKEAVLDGEAKAAAEKEPEGAPASAEEEMSEEDFRRLVEESLERLTVKDMVLTMMNQLASVGYMKMGLPENVNLKYRDFDQAGLAIDALEAMIKGAENRMPEDLLRPFRSTLANLQLNFVQLRRK
ncbi:MAG: DUF1844 domain-containing protein [Actinomycetota bacterium]|nr:DUF1844 domain-containing protein [Actinomycetota bacterium]MDD5667400.1 DUF1844 domain-containing protein [Actinomycetota bacterium]